MYKIEKFRSEANGEYYFKGVATNGQVIFISEGYKNKKDRDTVADNLQSLFTDQFKQKELAEWQNRNFDKVSHEDCLIGVMEEVGELSHAILKHKQKIRGYHDESKFIAEAEDAISDTIVYLTQMATILGINLKESHENITSEVLKRNWKDNKETGNQPFENTVESFPNDCMYNNDGNFADGSVHSTKCIYEDPEKCDYSILE